MRNTVDYLTHRLASTQGAVDQIFARRIGQLRAPSSAYAVFDRSGLVYGNAFGVRGAGDAVPTIDTGYRIASCTKSFTAAALLVLRDRGLLSLADTIDKMMPASPLIGAGPVPPTIGQLASMAGGLPGDDPWADRQESLSSKGFDALLARGIRFVRGPGIKFEYSNLGYAMLGKVIEAAAGMPYIEFVTNELLRPLGLNEIDYDTTVHATDGLAAGYRRLDGEWIEVGFSRPGAFSPIGGLFATPRALADWARWLAAAWDRSDDDEILATSSRREMQTSRTPIEGSVHPRGYGYGLIAEDTLLHGTVVSHSGGYPGFGAHMRWQVDSGIGIVAMENATYSGPDLPATTALATILDETLVPAAALDLWPETLAARATVERLVRQWDPAVAADLFAENVEFDDSVEHRRSAIAELARVAGIGTAEPVPLEQSSPSSTSPAQLAWTIPGATGSLRCAISLTPLQPPLVQTIIVRLG
ncbi:MAG: beta-lactamase family protein [Actinomycetota bacterium]|nr:beta-lactamase family protein [Actinomycetota bacterium]